MRNWFKIVPLLFLYACEIGAEWEQENPELPLVVIEGMLTNEATRHEVRVSRAHTRLNEPIRPVSGATVAITDQENLWLLTEDTGRPGVYLTRPDVRGLVGKRYFLYVALEGKEYLASAYMIPVEPIGELVFSSCGEDNYRALIPEAGDPYMLELTLQKPGPCETEEDCRGFQVFYHMENIDVNEFFKPNQEEVCFPAGTVLRMKKYSLTPEHQAFLRSLLSETEWRGGLFDVDRGNIITNFSDGAIGFFSACTIVSDSIVFVP